MANEDFFDLLKKMSQGNRADEDMDEEEFHRQMIENCRRAMRLDDDRDD